MHDGGWLAMGGGMVLFWLALAAVLALVLVAAVRAGRGPTERREESPEEILKRRYARGEIDREEFQHRLEDLRR